MKPLKATVKFWYVWPPNLISPSLFFINPVIVEVQNALDKTFDEVKVPIEGQLIDSLSIIWYDRGKSKE